MACAQDAGTQTPSALSCSCAAAAAALALPAGPGAQDKRADQTDSQAQRLVLLGTLSSLKSPPGALGEERPEVAACHPVLGQQVRGEEGLPVEAGTDRPGEVRARKAESREADAGAWRDAHTECRCRNLKAEGTAQGGPEPQLQYKQQRCRRERVTGCTVGEAVRKQLGGSHGDFLDPHKPWEMGVNPTGRWGLTGSHKVFAQSDSDSLWDPGNTGPCWPGSGLPEKEGPG